MHADAPRARSLAAAPWPAVPDDATMLVPVGSTEQHGPHLPPDVDTVIAVAVSDAAAARIEGVVRVAPAFG